MALQDDYFNQASNMFGQAAQYAIPLESDLDKASTRVSQRLARNQQGLEGQIKDRFAGRGLSNSGLYDSSLGRSRSEYQGNLGSALGELEGEYAKRRQEGANTLLGIGSGYGDIASKSGELGLGQQRLGLEETLGLGEIATKQSAIEAEKKANKQKNLIDSLLAFGTYGNIKEADGTGTQFDSNFDDLIAKLFGSLGVR